MMKDKHAYQFCTNLLELRFKDVRLRRALKQVDDTIDTLVQNEFASIFLLSYAHYLPGNEMAPFVAYCKNSVRKKLQSLKGASMEAIPPKYLPRSSRRCWM